MNTCSNCGITLEGGKFCGKCGTPVAEGVTGISEITQEAKPVLANDGGYVQVTHDPAKPNAVKEATSHYFNFIKDIWTQPTKAARSADESLLMNGVISVILYALMFPLILYVGMRSVLGTIGVLGEFAGAAVPLGKMFLQPFLYFTLFLAIVSVIMFGLIKLSNSNITYKKVLTLFGIYLIAPAIILVLSLLSLLVNIYSLFTIFLILGFLGLFASIAFSFQTLNRDYTGGLDPQYSTFLTYIGIGIVIWLFAESQFISNLRQFYEEMNYLM
ncbi:hypothetical protein GLW05_09605 [Pontibacillus yanchengensis]|uniref:Zinc-ribbon domain-containing protein n=1 Tax=Pontibacillus yanchengensis TaxID=462910 RepID=A0A6I5A0S4_9BACI|nr:zinc ribbon domain-containing protein [Pontibacillus yanchengensis]MYL33853.1 hypothetical protein [Pontibacillus yanchengensis]